MSKMITKANFAAILVYATACSFAAPVVVQKGSVAQYLYIPGTSVPSTGGGTSDGATAAKQFCSRYFLRDATFVIDQTKMLDPTVKIGARLVGGGAGGNGYHYDTISSNYWYMAGGGGGSTGVFLNGTLMGVGGGGDAPATRLAAGNVGGVTAVPEFTISRTGAASTIRVVVGAGGGSGAVLLSPYGPTPPDAQGGYGGAGVFGGGAGGSFSSPSLLATVAWPAGAKGGTTVAGTGAVAPATGSNQLSGGIGSAWAGGVPGGGTSAFVVNKNQSIYGSSMFPMRGNLSIGLGKLEYGLIVISGYLDVRTTVYAADNWYGYSTIDRGAASVTNYWQFDSYYSLHAGQTIGVPVSAANASVYGRGGYAGGASGSTSGTSGLALLFYSAPECTLF